MVAVITFGQKFECVGRSVSNTAKVLQTIGSGRGISVLLAFRAFLTPVPVRRVLSGPSSSARRDRVRGPSRRSSMGSQSRGGYL